MLRKVYYKVIVFLKMGGGVVMQITVVKEQKEQSVKPFGGSQNGTEQKKA